MKPPKRIYVVSTLWANWRSSFRTKREAETDIGKHCKPDDEIWEYQLVPAPQPPARKRKAARK